MITVNSAVLLNGLGWRLWEGFELKKRDVLTQYLTNNSV